MELRHGSKGVVLLVTLVLILTFIVSGCGNKPAQNQNNTPPVASGEAKPEKSKLKVLWSQPAITSAAILFIGIEKGFFQKYGIEVEQTRISSSTVATAAILAGEVDLGDGMGGPGAVSAVLEGADLKVIAALAPYTMASIMSQPAIKNYQDLKGKKIGITKIGSTSWFALRTAARRWGMDPDKDFTMIQTGGIGEIVGALKGGSIDAGVLFEHAIPQLKDMGYNELVNMFDVASLQSGVVATGAFLKANPKTMENFFKAYLESIKFFRENKAEALKISAAFMGVDEKTMPYLESAYDMIVASDNIIPKIPYPTADSIQSILLELPQDKAGKAKPEQFMDTSFLKKLEDSGFVAQLYKK